MSFHILINLSDAITENGVILDQVIKKLPKVLDTFLNTKATRSMLFQSDNKLRGFVGLDLDATEEKDFIDINVQEMCYCGNCPESEILSETNLLDRIQNNKRNKETKISKSVGQTDPKLEIDFSEIRNVKNRESFSKDSFVMSKRFGAVGQEEALKDVVHYSLVEGYIPKGNKNFDGVKRSGDYAADREALIKQVFELVDPKLNNMVFPKSNHPEAKEIFVDAKARESIEVLYKEIDILRQELFESRQLTERSELKKSNNPETIAEIQARINKDTVDSANILPKQETINTDNPKAKYTFKHLLEKFNMVSYNDPFNKHTWAFTLTEKNVEEAIDLLDIPVTNVSLVLKNEEEGSIFHTECSIGDIVFVDPNTMKYVGYISG